MGEIIMVVLLASFAWVIIGGVACIVYHLLNYDENEVVECYTSDVLAAESDCR